MDDRIEEIRASMLTYGVQGFEMELLTEVDRLREALIDATASLAGAASAYRAHASRHRSVGRAQPDPFFTTRAQDFDNAVERARAALGVVDDAPEAEADDCSSAPGP